MSDACETHDHRSSRSRSELRGELITPGDAAYDEARRVWNGMFDCRPAAIARVQGAVDVVAVVDFARETGTELAVRGGGHSSAGYSTVDGGIVLDFSRMKGVWVDPAREDGARAGGRALGRRRPRDAGARARRPRRPDLAHRHRRAHARRRHRLALAPARPDDRQPALGRARHRRRPARHRVRRPSTRTSSGACAAAPATSASSSRSSTGCTTSARSSSAGRSSTRSTTRAAALRNARDFFARRARRGRRSGSC